MPELKSAVFVAIAMLLMSTQSLFAAPDHGDPDRPTLPQGSPTLMKSGEVIWADDSQTHSIYDSVVNVWNPVSGELTKLTDLKGFFLFMAARSAQGIFLLGNAPGSNAQTMIFIAPDGKRLSTILPAGQGSTRLIVLKDQSALLVGGDLGGATVARFTREVQRVFVKDGALVVERLPDLPASVRRGYSVVALDDGRAMLLGGSNEDYSGCGFCVADTFMLDLHSKTWQAGPRMLEPRSNAAAALLPDGSVLVAGGWTPEHAWNDAEASRTTERWLPRENRFVSDRPLPSGVSGPLTFWAAGQQGRQLLLMGGLSKAWTGNNEILDYDVATGAWTKVGDLPYGSVSHENGDLRAGSMLYKNRMLAFIPAYQNPNRGNFFPLRMPQSSNATVARPSGFASPAGYRSNISTRFLLAQAASPGDIDHALWWIRQGADVRTRDDQGQTLLMLANHYWSTAQIKTLLDLGAEVNAADPKGATALSLAAGYGRADIATLLLERGADVNARDKEGKNALMIAVAYDKPELVPLLLAKGAEVNAVAADGSSALMRAAEYGEGDAVSALLGKGAKVDLQDARGKSALMLASSGNHAEVMQVLLQHGANVNATDRQGITAIGMLNKDNVEARQMLLAAGALTATKNPQWQGVWRGHLGKQEIVACFQLGDDNGFAFGSYYYAKYRQPIRLEQAKKDTQSDFILNLNEAKGAWQLNMRDKDTLTGEWSNGGKQFSLDLAKVDIANEEWKDNPCRSEAFNNGRKINPEFVKSESNLDGTPYRILTEKSGGKVSSFELTDASRNSEAINLQLRKALAETINDEFQCTVDMLGQFGQLGDYSSVTEPVMLTKHWLTAATSIDAYCGGAHPSENRSYQLWNLENGKLEDVWLWFNSKGTRRDGEFSVPGPALAAMLKKLWPKDAAPVDGACANAEDSAFWSIHPDRTGLVFSPELPHVIQACAEDLVMPYDKLEPLLNARGKLAVNSLVNDLAHH